MGEIYHALNALRFIHRFLAVANAAIYIKTKQGLPFMFELGPTRAGRLGADMKIPFYCIFVIRYAGDQAAIADGLGVRAHWKCRKK